MLCCLVGALLAGNLFAAWRIAVAATKGGVASWAWRGALVGALAFIPVAAVALAAFDGGHGAPDTLAASRAETPCLGEALASGR